MTDDASRQRSEVRRLRILGAPVDALTFHEALDCAVALAKDRSKVSCVVAVNPEKIMTARGDATLARHLNDADLAIPDGVGAVIAAKWLFGARIERVAGADLMPAICSVSGRENLRIFFYGSREEVSSRAEEVLRERYPDILIAGRENGYFPESRFDELVDRINSSDADVLFLALGSPKQELWIEKYRDKLNVGLCMGIGGSLDALTGAVKRAPVFWQRLRLEWFYRLVRQPSRFWRQRRIFFFAGRILLLKLCPWLRRNSEES